MKKFSIYSVLFALVLALNPMQTRPVEMSIPLSALGLGIVGLASVKYSYDKWMNAISNGLTAACADLDDDPKKQEFLDQAQSSLSYARMYLALGVASLLGAGYLTYKTNQG